MRSRVLILVPAMVIAGLVGFGLVDSRVRHPVVPIEVAPQAVQPVPAVQAPVALHYAPAENLEHVDVALIDGATRSIDMAAYVLTDWPVLQALGRAADRGVAVRILLDRAQHDERDEVAPMVELRGKPSVVIRIKRSRVYMHLKSYAVDDRWLRSGSANLSASGLKQQNNDAIVIDSPALAARFKAEFDPAFAAGGAE